MGKKKIIIIMIALIINTFIVFYNFDINETFKLNVQMTTDSNEEIKVYYTDNTIFEEANSQKFSSDDVKKNGSITVQMKSIPSTIRIDLGVLASNTTINKASLSLKDVNYDIPLTTGSITGKNFINDIQQNGQSLKIQSETGDPYICIPINNESIQKTFADKMHSLQVQRKIIYCIAMDLLFVFLFVLGEKILQIPVELLKNSKLILSLSRNDFKTRFAGSYFGIVWAFVNPIITILLYWIVFEFGLRAGQVGKFPFVLWLSAGLVPWFFYSEAVINATNSLLEYSYLVKKVVFQISILPTIKIISASFVHLFFILFTLCIYAIMGYFPTIYLVQLIYYFICMVALVSAVTYATSAMVLFFRDLGQIISIFMQVFMWATPIMWNESILPENLLFLFRLNPMYYIVLGYRDAFLNHVWFFEHVGLFVYFWTFVGFLYIIGTTIFRRLKPHFADVL